MHPNICQQKWFKWLDANGEFTQHFYIIVYITFHACSAQPSPQPTSHLSRQQLLSVSVPTFEHFCSQGAESGYRSAALRSDVIGGAPFRWALRRCFRTITLLSPSQSKWTSQHSETRRTLVCKPLRTDSEHLYSLTSPADQGMLLASHTEEIRFKVNAEYTQLKLRILSIISRADNKSSIRATTASILNMYLVWTVSTSFFDNVSCEQQERWGTSVS